jgi:hypothetical protein
MTTLIQKFRQHARHSRSVGQAVDQSIGRSMGQSVARFRRSQNGGVVTIEFILFLPILLFILVGGFAFFDAYREKALVQKAAFTVADLVSRETMSLNPDYIDSMYALMTHITRNSTPTGMRISVLQWDEDDQEFAVQWSQVRGTSYPDALTDTDAVALEDDLPIVPDADNIILVQSAHEYSMWTYLTDETVLMTNFVFARPRFGPTVPYDNGA